jgi:hypothetical protein
LHCHFYLFLNLFVSQSSFTSLSFHKIFLALKKSFVLFWCTSVKMEALFSRLIKSRILWLDKTKTENRFKKLIVKRSFVRSFAPLFLAKSCHQSKAPRVDASFGFDLTGLPVYVDRKKRREDLVVKLNKSCSNQVS